MSTMMTTQDDKPNNRKRESRPEVITISGKQYVRNDIQARSEGITTRTMDKRDAKGCPRAFFAGVKYRPFPEYPGWIESQINVKDQPPKRRARSMTSRRWRKKARR